MIKLRLFFLFLTFAVVGVVGTIVLLYARGFRLNPETRSFAANGLLVMKSHPDSAQVFINGELKTATNATIPLLPDTYDVTIRKEGFLEWKKRLTIEKEEVTEATAHLFRIAPSLSAATFTGIESPQPSPDLSKLAYIVTGSLNNDSEGLWIMETINLPLGFNREPHRITDGDLTGASFLWSPDAREILLKTTKGSYILDTSTFTQQSRRVNIASSLSQILEKWDAERQKSDEDRIKKLPLELKDIFERKVSQFVFSADEEMVVYSASASATIPDNLVKKLPGSSTQKQERDIKINQTYIYDIEEDRNFLITDTPVNLNGWVDYKSLENPMLESAGSKLPSSSPTPHFSLLTSSLSWYPSSRHVILADQGKITIMDYDGTNKQIVYSGSYVAPHAYPTLSLDRLLILTNLGAELTPPNLYSLSLK